MSEKSKLAKISRRKFINQFGTGVVSTYALFPALQKSTNKKIDKSSDERKLPLQLKVNGQNVKTAVDPETTLVELLRDELQLTGTKIVCNHGECGGCTVLLDGKAIYSCHMLALDADGKEVITIEGLLKKSELHPVQEAFVEKDGLQCGFCTPGQIMAAYALLLKNPNPTKEEVLKGMSGNLCRCAAYPKIIESVMEAAKKKGINHGS
jgi:aerobic-type carbon monoxide dehydrogenase small subunit (CoxS/CutS family)